MRPASAVTTFTVAMPNPSNHLFEIGMDVAPFSRAVASFDLCLPVWTPGSYLVRDHARHVRDLAVAGPAGEPLGVTKMEKSRWRVQVVPRAGRGPFRVTYRV